jgi:hypothetical protein
MTLRVTHETRTHVAPRHHLPPQKCLFLFNITINLSEVCSPCRGRCQDHPRRAPPLAPPTPAAAEPRHWMCAAPPLSGPKLHLRWPRPRLHTRERRNGANAGSDSLEASAGMATGRKERQNGWPLRLKERRNGLRLKERRNGRPFRRCLGLSQGAPDWLAIPGRLGRTSAGMASWGHGSVALRLSQD